jgi:pimeloyl-ACP methyl ester carboxylesterase
METRFATATDGTRIAYDVSGTGPLLALLHGLGSARSSWHEAGVVDALAGDWTVAAIDLRGHGESDKPKTPAAYGIETVLGDVAAVIAACGGAQASVWGFSYGGSIAAHAVRADWAERVIIAGSAFGRHAGAEWLERGLAQTEMVIAAIEAGQLDGLGLTPEQLAFIERNSPYVANAIFKAMAAWPDVQPADARHPALLLTGTRDEGPVEAVRAQMADCERAGVRVHILDGLDHQQLVTERDVVLPVARAFLRGTEAHSI